VSSLSFSKPTYFFLLAFFIYNLDLKIKFKFISYYQKGHKSKIVKGFIFELKNIRRININCFIIFFLRLFLSQSQNWKLLISHKHFQFILTFFWLYRHIFIVLHQIFKFMIPSAIPSSSYRFVIYILRISLYRVTISMNYYFKILRIGNNVIFIVENNITNISQFVIDYF